MLMMYMRNAFNQFSRYEQQSAIGCAHVRFAPGARTAWHHHPKGQTLYVTDGVGLVARRGGEVQEIRPGDVVYIEPARSTGTAPHPTALWRTLPCRKLQSGQVVTWLEHVTDKEYGV